MEQELFAYLICGNGRISEMSTDELLGPFHQLRQAGFVQGQNTASGEAALYAFLQALKQAKRAPQGTVVKQAE